MTRFVCVGLTDVRRKFCARLRSNSERLRA